MIIPAEPSHSRRRAEPLERSVPLPSADCARPAPLVRRGGVYVLVLGVSTMIAVVGLGAIAVSRADATGAAAGRDWAKAGVLAESAIETALARMNTTTTWRTDYAAGAEVSVGVSGNASASFRITDPADGDLEKFGQDSATITGYGRVGTALRIYSVQANYRPAPTLGVLTFALYSGVRIQSSGSGAATVSGAPLGTPLLINTHTLAANVHVGAVANLGTIVGEVRTGDAPMTTFSNGGLASLSASAVTITYSATNDKIQKVLLSPAVNPFGSTSSTGTYFVRVPASKVLEIHKCRIVGTLIVELGAGSGLTVSDEVNWSSALANQPALVVYATGASTVKLTGGAGKLDENFVNLNFNPASTPYNGVSNTNRTDQYPGEIRGIIHVMGTLPSMTIEGDWPVVGTVICEGTLTLGDRASIIYDPRVLIDPPPAYQTGAAGMSPVAGTGKSEVLP